MKKVILLLVLLLCLGCSENSNDDNTNNNNNENTNNTNNNNNNNNTNDDKYCKDKAEGAECDNSKGYCICFKGKAYLNIGEMCNEPEDCIDQECVGLHTGDSCGEGKVCSCGEGEECVPERLPTCLELKPYESES